MKERHDMKERIKATIMATRLLSGDLPEAESDRIVAYFCEEGSAEMKEEVMREVFGKTLRSGRLEGKGAGHAGIIWPKLAATLGIDPAAYRPARRVARRLLFGRVASRVAAALLPVAIVVGGYFAWDRPGSDNGAGSDISTIDVPAFVAKETIPARADSIRYITLADGTDVTLNRNSTFAYNDDREAELSGEAFFKVAKDPEHPFVIHSRGLKVSVLGTEFNFDTGTSDGTAKLSLYEGRVELDHVTGTQMLTGAGREFTLDHATGLTQIGDFDTTQRPQWLAAAETSSGIMSVGAIFDRIEAVYGVMIVNRGAVDADRQLKFNVDATVPLDGVMSRLEFLNGEFAYSINGTTVTLTKKQPR